jgi:hypothetical protein
MYGGGPVLVREDLDIYSKDLSRELTSKRKNETKKESNNNIFASQKPSFKSSQLMNPTIT